MAAAEQQGQIQLAFQALIPFFPRLHLLVAVAQVTAQPQERPVGLGVVEVGLTELTPEDLETLLPFLHLKAVTVVQAVETMAYKTMAVGVEAELVR